MKERIYSLIIAVSLFSSCEKTIEVDYSKINMTDKIVIQAYLNSETDIKAYIYKTLPLNNVIGNSYLQSPNVWLYQNEEVFTQLHETDSSLYVLNDSVKLQKNTDYKLVVEAEGFETAVSNSQQIIEPVTIDSVYKEYDTIRWLGNFYVQFNDPNPDYNKYSIQINTYSRYMQNADGFIGGTLNDEGFTTNSRLYSDTYKTRSDSAIVKIYTYSQTLIDFEDSYSNYEVSYGEKQYESVFPVENFITNGYGFFGAQAISTYTFIWEKRN